MTYQFRPAVRQQTSLLIAVAGASGSGKTYSALRLATGLAGPKGKIAFIDTEAGRALHYADKFAFDHCNITPPFRPENYRDAIVAAETQGYDVIIVDSMSHEKEGEGGLQEWAEQIERDGTKSPGNWRVPKMHHKRMMNRLLQCRPHLIFCLRAEEKMLITKDERGKMLVIPAEERPLTERWEPICEKRFMYEMTASFTLLPSRPGVPIPIKLQDQHRPAFPEGQPIEEQAGESLAKWAHGGKVPVSKADEDALREARDMAAKGRDAFLAWWNGDGKTRRGACRAYMTELQATADAADRGAAPAVDDDNPFDDPQPPGDLFQPAEPPPVENASEPDSSEDDWMQEAHDLQDQVDSAKSVEELEVMLASKRFAGLERMATAAPQQHSAVTDFIAEKRKGLGG